MPSTRVIPVGFVIVEATSSKGNAWLKLASVDKDDVVHADEGAYLIPANKLDEAKALRASLKGQYDALTAHIAKLESATPAAPAQAAPDTRVDALAAKVDALTEAMTALAQLVAKNATAPAAPAKANGKAPAAPVEAPANPLADLPF